MRAAAAARVQAVEDRVVSSGGILAGWGVGEMYGERPMGLGVGRRRARVHAVEDGEVSLCAWGAWGGGVQGISNPSTAMVYWGGVCQRGQAG